MKRILAGALLLSSCSFLGTTPILAQGLYIGPGGVGVDSGRRYRDDDDYDRYRSRRHYRDSDDEDYRPRRRRHYRDDDDN